MREAHTCAIKSSFARTTLVTLSPVLMTQAKRQPLDVALGGFGAVGKRVARSLDEGMPAGHLGDQRVTVRSLEVIAADKQKNLLMVKGPVPGAKQGLVLVRQAKRLYKSKAAKATAS